MNSAGEPTDPSDPTQLAPWYHISGEGQAQNLQITDQCPFPSGACYTLSDSGTFNYLVSTRRSRTWHSSRATTTGAGAVGGVSLLLNPYHLYAVNPAKITTAYINLPGALAFLNFMTSPTVQTAIGNYPSPANPAFIPTCAPT